MLLLELRGYLRYQILFYNYFLFSRNFWNMRFEAKHQHLKRLASVVRNFQNISLTLSMRTQYLQCYLFNESCMDTVFLGTKTKPFETSTLCDELRVELLKLTDLPELPMKVVCAQSITKNYLKYQLGSVLAVGHFEDNDIPIFGKIYYIFQLENKWIICCKIMLSDMFNGHYHAYEVKEIDRWFVTKATSMHYQCLDLYSIHQTSMVKMKYVYC